MTYMNKTSLIEALIDTTGPGKVTIRELDKVIVRIQKGEFDLPEQPIFLKGGTPEQEDAEFDIQQAGEELARYVAEEALEEAAIVKDWIVLVDYIGEDTGAEGFISQTGTTYASNPTGSMSAALGMMSIVRQRLLQVDADNERYGQE